MEIIKQKYTNGVRSLSVLTSDTQAVTIMFLVKVGSRYENPAEEGLAHFVEHTLFKGTNKRPSSKQIGMEIESLGGTSNAFTSYDYTGYYIKAPAINFVESFEILADMFKNSQFSQDEIAKERGVIIEEIKMYEDRPTSKVAEAWSRNFFQNSTLGLEITGTIDSVKQMKQQQFFDFMAKHYYGENVLIVIAGNIDQTIVEKLINGNCSDIPAQADRVTSAFAPFKFEQDPNRKKYLKIIKDVEQTHVILGGLAINRNDPRRFALQVANTILANGFGSRLFQVIRDELGLAYYIYSRLANYEDTGVFQIGLGVDSTRVEEAINAVKKELTSITNGDFTDAEFRRAKNYLLGNLITELETSEDIASYYGMQDLLQTERLTIAEVKEKILSISLNDIHEICAELFFEDNYHLAVLAKN